MKTLVVGANGATGKQLVEQLIENEPKNQGDCTFYRKNTC
jgi:uncharacterized protein YbjT (DUF2867 family)